MKLGMNDMRARGYKVTEQILNNCINYYATYVKTAHKTQRRDFSREALVTFAVKLLGYFCDVIMISDNIDNNNNYNKSSATA